MPDARYYRIAPKFWRHAAVNQWPDQVGYLALYLLTSPHRNIAGLYYLPQPYIMADLGWDDDAVTKSLDALIAEDFVRYDATAHVILIVNALSYDAPENTNQRKGAIKALNEVPATALWGDLYAIAQSHNKDFAHDVYELMLKRFPKLFQEPLAKQLPEPIPEQNGNSVAVSVTVTDSTTTSTTCARPDLNWSDLEQAWFNHLGGTISAIAREELPMFARDGPDGPALPLDVIVFAMQEADRNHVRTWAYVHRILTNYRKDGIVTVADCEARNAQRQQHQNSLAKGDKTHDNKTRHPGARRMVAGSDWSDDSDPLGGLHNGGTGSV